MGVKLLTSYVNQHYDILYKDEIDLKNKTVLFDGSSLYYALIGRVPRRFGGNYDQLYKSFSDFFEILSGLNITAHIVLDGGLNVPLKTETIRERLERDINNLRNVTILTRSELNLPIPILTSKLFMEVLHTLGINFVVAKKEADLLVAALANRLGCPVVSADSDFFLTNVEHGVLKMDDIVKIHPKCTKFHYYKSGYLAEYLKLSVIMFPFIAVFMGNDYSSEAVLSSVQKSSGIRNNHNHLLSLNPRMLQIVKYLQQSNFVTREDVVNHLCLTSSIHDDKDTLREEIEAILLEFDVNSVKDECDELYGIITKSNIVSIESLRSCGRNVESLVQILCCQGLINPAIMDILFSNLHFISPQCENTAQKCSSELSQELRNIIYIITLSHTANDVLKIQECKRAGSTYKKGSIQIYISEFNKMPTDIISGQYSQHAKREYLLQLGFSMKNVNRLDELDDCVVMFLLSMRYWIQQSYLINDKIRIELIQALLVAFIQLFYETKKGEVVNESIDLVIAHHLCRWQSILFYFVMLNDLLLRPLTSVMLKNIYNGNITHNIHKKLVEENSPYDILGKQHHGCYDMYLQILTDDLTGAICIQKSKPHKSSKNKPKEQKLCNSSQNRFAMLMMEDDDISC